MAHSIGKGWWIITVAGYGTFAFKGSGRAAEEMRSHKAQWEGAVARKWRADPNNDTDRMLIEEEAKANRKAGKHGSSWRLG